MLNLLIPMILEFYENCLDLVLYQSGNNLQFGEIFLNFFFDWFLIVFSFWNSYFSDAKFSGWVQKILFSLQVLILLTFLFFGRFPQLHILTLLLSFSFLSYFFLFFGSLFFILTVSWPYFMPAVSCLNSDFIVFVCLFVLFVFLSIVFSLNSLCFLQVALFVCCFPCLNSY